MSDKVYCRILCGKSPRSLFTILTTSVRCSGLQITSGLSYQPVNTLENVVEPCLCKILTNQGGNIVPTIDF